MAAGGSKRYKSPPNWPARNEDWTPPPGWQPDPSWPPAPLGWEFWVDNGATGVTQADSRGYSTTSNIVGVLTQVTQALRTYKGHARVLAKMVRITVNPRRAVYATAAATGAILFLWMFASLRFTNEWTFSGWMWHGIWPVLAMCGGLVIAIYGAVRARHWNRARWTQRDRPLAESTQ